MKLNENTKITLTVGQLKRLIREETEEKLVWKHFDEIKRGDRGYTPVGGMGTIIEKGTIGEFADEGYTVKAMVHNEIVSDLEEMEKVGLTRDFQAVLVSIEQKRDTVIAFPYEDPHVEPAEYEYKPQYWTGFQAYYDL